MINTIILGHALNVLPKLPAGSVNCVITSPPYWGLRDYGVEPVVWDGDKKCKHKWTEDKTAGDIRFRGKGSIVGNNRNTNIYPIKHRPNETNPGKEGWYKDKGGLSKNPSQSNLCTLCGAWRGSLGLEPDFNLYVKHLCDIFDEIKRVLKKDGTCFVNLGDSYGGSGNRSSHTLETSNLNRLTIGYGATEGNQKATKGYEKSLLLIPQRFAIEMVDRGWILRNIVIWYKLNCMPSSAKDRFTVDFEDVFFFTKNNKAIFWINEKTLECVDKKPLGTKGVEGKDWEWRPCPACSDKDYFNYRTRDIMRKEKDCPQFKASNKEKENIKNKVCPRCRGAGKIKYPFWSGHDYWFEQQFEGYAPDTLPRMDRGVNVNKWTLGADGQTPHNLSQPRLNKKRGYKIKQQGEGIHRPQHHGKDISYGKQGRNKRCVWTIPTKSFPEAHFAVYPETLIEPMIKAGCPEFVCKKCGKARVRVVTSESKPTRPARSSKDTEDKIYAGSRRRYMPNYLGGGGLSDCGCNAGWESGITLDPFMGAGTTALVTLEQRKRFIGIEIKQEYIDMSYKRVARVQQRIF